MDVPIVELAVQRQKCFVVVHDFADRIVRRPRRFLVELLAQPWEMDFVHVLNFVDNTLVDGTAKMVEEAAHRLGHLREVTAMLVRHIVAALAAFFVIVDELASIFLAR